MVPPLSKKRKTPNSGKDIESLPLFFCCNPFARTGRRGRRPLQKKMLCCAHLFWRGSAAFIDSLKRAAWLPFFSSLFYRYKIFKADVHNGRGMGQSAAGYKIHADLRNLLQSFLGAVKFKSVYYMIGHRITPFHFRFQILQALCKEIHRIALGCFEV